MRKIIVSVAMLALTFCAAAQDPTPADKGVTYGAGTTAQGAVPVAEVEANMQAAKFTGKTTGKVLSVCQERGCWMKIERANGEAMMVKFKDYGFFMPKNIVGKEVVLDGEATVKETSVKQLKHYAGDAGKSKEEISKITSPKKELIFTAKGVLVL
jgi:Domain of unknown function (DUF4920)